MCKSGLPQDQVCRASSALFSVEPPQEQQVQAARLAVVSGGNRGLEEGCGRVATPLTKRSDSSGL